MPFKIILAALFVALPAWAEPAEERSPTERLNAFRTTQAFDCRDVSCKRLSSCAEACYKLLQCGQTKRDGDRDGIPCENLCSRRC
ncbi:excalibur calcium-binding domain-containing protein [Primorskyibacter sp. 2E233]